MLLLQSESKRLPHLLFLPCCCCCCHPCLTLSPASLASWKMEGGAPPPPPPRLWVSPAQNFPKALALHPLLPEEVESDLPLLLLLLLPPRLLAPMLFPKAKMVPPLLPPPPPPLPGAKGLRKLLQDLEVAEAGHSECG